MSRYNDVCVSASVMSSEEDKLHLVTKTVLCSLLPLILITVFVVAVFWLYRQRTRHFLHRRKRDGEPVTAATSLLGHSSHMPASTNLDIRLVEMIASGRFGTVWKAELDDGALIAVKISPEHDRQSWLCEQRFYALPCTTNCANVLRFIGAESRGAELWLVTEYVADGSLYDYLKAHTVTLVELASIAMSVTRGLAFLHSDVNGKPSVAHRDIKSRNVLLRADMTACIADFGLSLVLDGPLSTALPQVLIYYLLLFTLHVTFSTISHSYSLLFIHNVSFINGLRHLFLLSIIHCYRRVYDMRVCCCGPGGRWWQPTTGSMTMHAVTCRLTA